MSKVLSGEEPLHIKKINETSSKGQKELQELRIIANQVDQEDNNIKAIVSVLMLKEGWDVKNVTTIIRKFIFSSKIKNI